MSQIDAKSSSQPLDGGVINGSRSDSKQLSENADTLYDSPEDLSKQTALHNRYSFWFHRRSPQSKSSSYEDSILKIASFQTAEHFWRIYNHLIRPNDLKQTTDYHLFKDGIKPTWEDPMNKNGGKWMIRIKKGLTSLYWEELILAIIGEQFDVGHEICGAVVSIRSGEDIISVWNKNSDNAEATSKIRDQLKRILKLPVLVSIEYKKHMDSISDNSSYRNPTIVWRAPSTRGNEPVAKEQSNTRQHGYPNRTNFSSTTGMVRSKSESLNNTKSRWDNLPSSSNNKGSWRTSGASWSKDAQQNSWSKDNLRDFDHPEDNHISENPGLSLSNDNDVNDVRTKPDENPSSLKGKNIGGWVKSQLLRGQSEGNIQTLEK